MNYGETVAYWYLRLNGFIPMTNFVLHQPDPEKKYNSDSDLLAVRFPHAFEKIGGKPEDWDNERFHHWGLDHFKATILAICEVKTGKYKKSAINNAFKPSRLRYALRRLGAISPDLVPATADGLSTHPIVAVEAFGQPFQVVKMVIHVEGNKPGKDEEDGLALTPCLFLDLKEALAFIRGRMNKYAGPKGAARMFFPGDLIQFLAWEAGVKVDVDPSTDEEDLD